MKKMRRMIPALCMLLVSAIMLSTASYAWFTMNEQVTATGMQVQAKATGSLVISDSELKYNVTNTEVDFSEDAIKQLSPIHLAVTKDNAGNIAAFEAWQKPAADAVVHKELGTITYGALTEVNAGEAANSYFDKVVYIGTAGDAPITENISIDLRAIASAAGNATQAYSVAVYVVGVVTGTADGLGDVDWDETPDAIVHVDSDRSTATLALSEDLEDGKYIPSIVGIGAQTNEVTGLKIVLRVFVDGALDDNNAKKTVWDGTYTYSSATGNYVSTKTYFTPVGYVALTEDELKAAVGGIVPKTGWFVQKVTETEVEGEDEPKVEVTYEAATPDEVIEWNTDDNGNVTSAKKTYYVEAYAPADLNNLQNVVKNEETGAITSATLPNNWYTRVEDTTTVWGNFVNSDDIPSSGSTLAINFKTTIAE